MYFWCIFSIVFLYLDCFKKFSLLGFLKIKFSCIIGVVLVFFFCILIVLNIIVYWDFFFVVYVYLNC